jgi:hypothetical protein
VRRLVFGFLLTFALTGLTPLAARYKVTRVIEVGPAVPLLTGGALKWSPDGTMLAYFADNYLMISDTLGNSRQVAPIAPPMFPARAEWVSNNEFAVSLNDREHHDSALYQLVVYDVTTGAERLVDEYWRTAWTLMPGHESYSGPYLTLEGNAYYVRTVVTGLEGEDLDAVRRSRVFETTRLPLASSRSAATALASSHLQIWGKDGLYAVSWNGDDSLKLSDDLAAGALRMGTTVSKDLTWVFRRGVVWNRFTHDTLDVRLFDGESPPETQGCGFGGTTFNPCASELLFEHYCEGGESYVVDRVGLFNYDSRQFTLLDTLTGISGGSSPVYNPNGRMIAFYARARGYIVWREETELVKGKKI